MNGLQIFLVMFGFGCLIGALVVCGLVIVKCAEIERQIDQLTESIERRNRSR